MVSDELRRLVNSLCDTRLTPAGFTVVRERIVQYGDCILAGESAALERVAELEAEVERLRVEMWNQAWGWGGTVEDYSRRLEAAQKRIAESLRAGESAALERIAELEAEATAAYRELERVLAEASPGPGNCADLWEEDRDNSEPLTGCEHRDCLGVCDPDCDEGCEEREP